MQVESKPQLLEPTGDPPLHLQSEHFPVAKLNGTYRRIGFLSERPVYCKINPDGSGANICLWNFRNIWTITKLTDLGKSNIYARSKDPGKDPSKLKDKWKVFHNEEFTYFRKARFKFSTGPGRIQKPAAAPAGGSGASLPIPWEDQEHDDDLEFPQLKGGWATVAPLKPPPLAQTGLLPEPTPATSTSPKTADEMRSITPDPVVTKDIEGSDSPLKSTPSPDTYRSPETEEQKAKERDTLAPGPAASTLHVSFSQSSVLGLSPAKQSSLSVPKLKELESGTDGIMGFDSPKSAATESKNPTIEIGSLVKVVSKNSKKNEGDYSKVAIVRGAGKDCYKLLFFHRFDLTNLSKYPEEDLEAYPFPIDLREINVEEPPASPRNSGRSEVSDASSVLAASVNEGRGDDEKEDGQRPRKDEWERTQTLFSNLRTHEAGVRRMQSSPLRSTVPRNFGSVRTNNANIVKFLGDLEDTRRIRARSMQDLRKGDYPDVKDGIIKQGLLLKKGGRQNKLIRNIQERNCVLDEKGKFSYSNKKKLRGEANFANRVVTLNLNDDLEILVQTFAAAPSSESPAPKSSKGDGARDEQGRSRASRRDRGKRVWNFQPLKSPSRTHIERLEDAFSWALAFGYFSQTDKTGRLLRVDGFSKYGPHNLGGLNDIWINSGVIIVFKHEITKRDIKRYMYRSSDWKHILWYSPHEHNWVIAPRKTPTKYICRTKNSDVKYPSDLRKGTVWTICNPNNQARVTDIEDVHCEAYQDLASVRSSKLLRPMGGTLRRMFG